MMKMSKTWGTVSILILLLVLLVGCKASNNMKLQLDKSTVTTDGDGDLKITGVTNPKAKVSISDISVVADSDGKFTLESSLLSTKAKSVEVTAKLENKTKTAKVKLVPSDKFKDSVWIKVKPSFTTDKSGNVKITGVATPKASIKIGWGIIGDHTTASEDGSFVLKESLDSLKTKTIEISASKRFKSKKVKVEIKPSQAFKDSVKINVDQKDLTTDENGSVDITGLSTPKADVTVKSQDFGVADSELVEVSKDGKFKLPITLLTATPQKIKVVSTFGKLSKSVDITITPSQAFIDKKSKEDAETKAKHEADRQAKIADDAENKVKAFEEKQTEDAIQTAQSAVDKVVDANQKSALQARIDAVKNAIASKQAQEKADKLSQVETAIYAANLTSGTTLIINYNIRDTGVIYFYLDSSILTLNKNQIEVVLDGINKKLHKELSGTGYNIYKYYVESKEIASGKSYGSLKLLIK